MDEEIKEASIDNVQHEPKVWDEEIYQVGDRRWKFRHIPGLAMKKLQRSCRNPRTGDIDEVRYFQRLCEEIIVGEVDENGTLIPGSRFDPAHEPEVVCTKMEDALMTFLGYS